MRLDSELLTLGFVTPMPLERSLQTPHFKLIFPGKMTPVTAPLRLAQVGLIVKHQAAKEAPVGFDEGGYGSSGFHDTLTNSFW